ncbi:hypothetical protein HDU90_003609 [Geranomyces variabilis]|nr:hypothetical protein HDU90_003609 [Geranomyces variabilis]
MTRTPARTPLPATTDPSSLVPTTPTPRTRRAFAAAGITPVVVKTWGGGTAVSFVETPTKAAASTPSKTPAARAAPAAESESTTVALKPTESAKTVVDNTTDEVAPPSSPNDKALASPSPPPPRSTSSSPLLEPPRRKTLKRAAHDTNSTASKQPAVDTPRPKQPRIAARSGVGRDSAEPDEDAAGATPKTRTKGEESEMAAAKSRGGSASAAGESRKGATVTAGGSSRGRPKQQHASSSSARPARSSASGARQPSGKQIKRIPERGAEKDKEQIPPPPQPPLSPVPKRESALPDDQPPRLSPEPSKPRQITLVDALDALPREALERLVHFSVVEKLPIGAAEIASELRDSNVFGT